MLIDNGEVEKEAMSMLAIREWADKHSEQEVRKLLEQNPSFVFFKPEPFTPVRGASAIPLIAKASVASDRSIIPAGTVLLAEIPILDNTGKFTGQYQMRLMVALDVGEPLKDIISIFIMVLVKKPDKWRVFIIIMDVYGY